MNSFTYDDSPNQNLVCCICRMPFVDPCTNQTCSHTFCRECIVQSLVHSPQCPIDRSPLRIEDIHSADPIIRSLVDELVVKCSNESAGCSYTCQRQLLDAHIKTDCQYTLVPCPNGACSQILRKDRDVHICAHTLVKCEDCEESVKYNELESHRSNCLKKSFICSDCNTEYPCPSRTAHAAICRRARVKCSHELHGCPWEGQRQDLPSHTSACPYEAIRGFFAIQDTQKTALANENTLLNRKIQALESQLRIVQSELRSAQTALGPWFRNSKPHTASSHSIPSTQLPIQLQSISASSSSRPPVSPTDPSSLTQYFADISLDDTYESAFSRVSREEEAWTQPHPLDLPPSGHSHRASFSGMPSQFAGPLPTGARSQQNVIAPINLNTTLEGSLEGLRESIVVLSTSLDSLSRRSDIALTNETLRLNEEVRSLRATMHGLRMQVHTIMMDRNAQVTGRGPGTDPMFMQVDQWVRMQNAPPSSITKL